MNYTKIFSVVVNVAIRSEGCADLNKQGPSCGWAYIQVNGHDYSLHRRGFNLVVLHTNGEFLTKQETVSHLNVSGQN